MSTQSFRWVVIALKWVVFFLLLWTIVFGTIPVGLMCFCDDSSIVTSFEDFYLRCKVLLVPASLTICFKLIWLFQRFYPSGSVLKFLDKLWMPSFCVLSFAAIAVSVLFGLEALKSNLI